MDIAYRHYLLVIEDAAQGVMASYKSRSLVSISDLVCYSFHETKNLISGEGGALLINNPAFVERAEIIRYKGTNRSQFFGGRVEKYTWVDIGSSYLPGELTAAFLWAQLEQANIITTMRLNIWNRYHNALLDLELAGRLHRPMVPDCSFHNAHMYYILLDSEEERTSFISRMKVFDIHCVFHYVPLHTSPFARRLGWTVGDLPCTENLAARLIRLPMWIGVENVQDSIVENLTRAFFF